MFDWSDFRYFLALVDDGSALAASRRLHTNQTTVSRRIARLESALGLQLFERTTRGYTLTANGAALEELARDLQRAAEALELRATSLGREVAGTIRFSGNITTMRIYGLPLMERFREKHPEVVFEVDTQSRQVSLEKGEADIAMRSTDRVTGDELIARKFDEQPWGFYCSEEYASTYGRPGSLEECAKHRILMYSESLRDKIACLGWLRSQLPEDGIAFRVDSTAGMSGALRTGAGVGLLPRVIGDDIAQLCYCFGHERLYTPIWLVVSKEGYATPLLRRFLDFFVENFASVRRTFDE